MRALTRRIAWAATGILAVSFAGLFVGLAQEYASRGETGFVVPPGDAEALAEAMVALAGDLERASAMGAAGRERALAEFPPERSVERIEALYREAVGSGTP